MKGGIATESLIVTVGTPVNSNQILGRVVWGGQPVYGARVWSSAGGTVYQAWTDSDGTYVLTDLASTNTYPVNCSAAGLTFTPQFANPVSVASGNVFGSLAKLENRKRCFGVDAFRLGRHGGRPLPASYWGAK